MTETPTPTQNASRWAVPVLVACALLALFWPKGDTRKDAPGGTLVDGHGAQVPLSARMNKVTLVHFWATWCPPCVTETPTLLRLREDFAGEGEFSLVMIAVADDIEKVTTFLGPEGAAEVLYDNSWEVTTRYGTEALPESYLVKGGKVLEYYVGPQDWDDPAIREQILQTLHPEPEPDAS